MKVINISNKISAFTLVETLLVLVITGIIVFATINAGRDRYTFYLNKFMYYSAFTNLINASNKLLADGCTSTDVTNSVCSLGSGVLPKLTGTTARGLCDRLVDTFNITPISTATTFDCSQKITNETGQFDIDHVNFITSNGMRFFNFGTAPTQTPSPNGPEPYTYTIYVDIDGSNRNAKLNEDVMKFTIATDGTVLPWAGTGADNGATNPDYLTASARYVENSTYTYVPGAIGVNYFNAYCAARGSYPNANCGAIVLSPNCDMSRPTGHNCEVVPDKPKYSLF